MLWGLVFKLKPAKINCHLALVWFAVVSFELFTMRNEFKNSAFTTKEIDATVPVTSRRTRKWEVGDVLDHKKDESGDHFFVSWKGWAEKYNSWEPRSSFHSDLIEEYFLRKSAPASLVVPAVERNSRPKMLYVHEVKRKYLQRL